MIFGGGLCSWKSHSAICQLFLIKALSSHMISIKCWKTSFCSSQIRSDCCDAGVSAQIKQLLFNFIVIPNAGQMVSTTASQFGGHGFESRLRPSSLDFAYSPDVCFLWVLGYSSRTLKTCMVLDQWRYCPLVWMWIWVVVYILPCDWLTTNSR